MIPVIVAGITGLVSFIGITLFSNKASASASLAASVRVIPNPFL